MSMKNQSRARGPEELAINVVASYLSVQYVILYQLIAVSD